MPKIVLLLALCLPVLADSGPARFRPDDCHTGQVYTATDIHMQYRCVDDAWHAFYQPPTAFLKLDDAFLAVVFIAICAVALVFLLGGLVIKKVL